MLFRVIRNLLWVDSDAENTQGVISSRTLYRLVLTLVTALLIYKLLIAPHLVPFAYQNLLEWTLLIGLGASLLFFYTHQYNSGSRLLSTTLWLFQSITVILTGVQAPNYASYLFILIVIGLLIDLKTMTFTAVFTIIGGLALGWLQQSGLWAPIYPPSTHPFSVSLAQNFTLLINTCIAAIGLNSYRLSHFRSMRELKDRQAAEAGLRDSENKFRALFEATSEANLLLTDGVCFDCNPACLNLFHATREQLIGHRPEDWSPLRQPDGTFSVIRSQQFFSEALTEGYKKFEWLHRRPDQSDFWAEIILTRIEMDGKPILYTTCRDITERKKSEEALRLSAQRANALVQLNQMEGAPLQEILTFSLKEAVYLTNSQTGYLGFVTPDQSQMTVYSWSRKNSQDGALLQDPVECGLRQNGLWDEVIRQRKPILNNKCQVTAPIEQGIPEDLANFTRHMSVPVFSEDLIEIIAGVGNKTDAYDDADATQLMLLMKGVWRLFERRTTKEQLLLQMQRLHGLRAIDASIISGSELKHTLEIVLQQVIQTLGVVGACLYIYSEADDTLNLAASRGIACARPADTLKEDWPIWKSIAQKRTFQWGNAPLPGHCSPPDRPDIRPYSATPVIIQDEIKGVLEVFMSGKRAAPDAEWVAYFETLAGQAAIAIANSELLGHLRSKNEELIAAYEGTIAGWARTLEIRDKETFGHSERVMALSLKLAQKLELPTHQIKQFQYGVYLHDIGKIGIPDSILLKPGPLTDDEWQVMRRHPEMAYEFLKEIAFLERALEVPYCHHERWDGSGYPRQLKGEEIPLTARIFAVVDVWDALVSDRPYRTRWQTIRVVEYLRQNAGVLFDPGVVEAFLELIENGEAI